MNPFCYNADLHHGNILSATRQPYLAIDPKGIVGVRGYDVGTFLLNPFGINKRMDLDELLDARLNIFSEMLGLTKGELASWGFVHALLSACWSIDEGKTNEGTLFVAGRLERLL